MKTILRLVPMMILNCILVNNSWAVKELGNGGDAVYCQTADGKFPVMLDVVQAKSWGHEIEKDLAEKHWNEVVTYSFRPLERIESNGYARLMKRFKEISTEMLKIEKDESYQSDLVSFTGQALGNISDEDFYALPSECDSTLVQAAVRNDHVFPGETKFVINQKVWSAMNDLNKAALIVHEIVFEDLLENASQYEELTSKNVVVSSKQARYYTSMLLSGYLTDVKTFLKMSSILNSMNIVPDEEYEKITRVRSSLGRVDFITTKIGENAKCAISVRYTFETGASQYYPLAQKTDGKYIDLLNNGWGWGTAFELTQNDALEYLIKNGNCE